MPEVISTTSPLQYLHQVELLEIMRALVGRRILIPPAVADELETGRKLGLELPDPTHLDWIEIRHPASQPVLPLITDLGPGETEVFALALEQLDSIVIIDDGQARRIARDAVLKVSGELFLTRSFRRGWPTC